MSVTPLKFLKYVWGTQPQDEGYVFLAWRDESGSWQQKAFELAGLDDLPRAITKKANLYFCPTVFSEPHRQKRFALPTRWLHSDLDERSPRGLDHEPTHAWQTSPKRYQGLWKLKSSLKPPTFERVNQKLNYHIEADLNGWSLTKVLRVPGTTSTKYEEPHTVTSLWMRNKKSYHVKDIWSWVKGARTAPQLDEVPELNLPTDLTKSAIIRKYKIRGRALTLLNTQRARKGERSERLWELECLLLKAGVPPEETLIAVKSTVWNKFRGQRRELRQLWFEINKAQQHLKEKQVEDEEEEDSKDELHVVALSDFVYEKHEPPGWMVEGIWSDSAHGVVTGEPKTYKSLIALDLAVSVASGTQFLDTFDVPTQGPVLIVDRENTVPMTQDRLLKIMSSRELAASAKMKGDDELRLNMGEDLPIHLVMNADLDLGNEHYLKQLALHVQTTKAKLLILDPLYLLTPGMDENVAREVTPILNNLLKIKQAYNCGILIVHHYKKQDERFPTQGGARISGSSVFWRWFESALFLERSEEPYTINMIPEHRAAPPQGMIEVEFFMGDYGDYTYRPYVTHKRMNRADEYTRLKDLVMENPGVSVIEVCKVLDMDKRTVMKRAERCGLIVKSSPEGKSGRPRRRLYPHE